MSKNTIIKTLLCMILCFHLYGDLHSLQVQGDSPEADRRVWGNKPGKIPIDESHAFIYHRDRTSSLTVVKIFIKGGRAAEPAGLKGLAYLTTSLSTTLPEYNDNTRLFLLGSKFYAAVNDDYAVITIESMSEYLDLTLELLVRCIEKPIFSTSRIKHLKNILGYYQKEEKDAPFRQMNVHFADIFYPGTPYSGSQYGTPESLKRITVKAIKELYNNNFHHSNIVLSVSSDLSKSAIGEIMKKHFAGFLRRNKKATATPIEVQRRKDIKRTESFYYKDTEQTLVAMGTLLPVTSPLNYTKQYVLKYLLGVGSGSRLWPLRSQKKLAYSLGALVKQMKHGSILQMFLKTDSSKQDHALASMREILAELHHKGVMPEEFQEAKIHCRVAFLLENQSKGSMAYNLGAFECMGLGYLMTEEFFTMLDQLTLEDFNQYIKEVLAPEKLAVVVIGRN